MSAQKIRAALGQLQDDPDNESSWNELTDAVTASENAGGEAERLGGEAAAIAAQRRALEVKP